jgi:hypothetical protein
MIGFMGCLLAGLAAGEDLFPLAGLGLCEIFSMLAD